MTKGEALEKVLRALFIVPRKATLHLNWAERDEPLERDAPAPPKKKPP